MNITNLLNRSIEKSFMSKVEELESHLGILFQPSPVLITLYVPLIIVSLLANSLLILVAVKCNYTKNVTNIFLINLAAADLLVTSFCMPIQLSKAVTLVWFYGEPICKLVNYMQGVAVSASVFTITAMSVDRWFSISPEARLRPPGRRQAVLLLLLIWCAALLIFFPLIMVATVQRETIPLLKIDANGTYTVTDSTVVNFCTENWSTSEKRKQFGILSFSLVYAIPGCITIVSYAAMGRTLCSVRPPLDMDEGSVGMQQGLRLIKERRRVAWILLLLAAMFALCWLPYNIMLLLLDINDAYTKFLSALLPYALLLGHANSAINPIVYCLMTRNFQRSITKVLCSKKIFRQTFRWPCQPKPDGSSSDYDLYHEPHKRCYIPINTLRQNTATEHKDSCTMRVSKHAHDRGVQLTHGRRCAGPTRAAPARRCAGPTRAAPARMQLSAEMLQRHCRIDFGQELTR